MLLCAVLADDHVTECGKEIPEPKGYNYFGPRTGETEKIGICNDCLEIGALAEKPEVQEKGLYSCVWLRYGEPTKDKDGSWWSHYEVDSHHYYLDSKEIGKDEYYALLDTLQST